MGLYSILYIIRKDIGIIIKLMCEKKRCGINRSRNTFRPSTYISEYIIKNEHIEFHRIFEGKVLMIFYKHANLKYKYESRVFWAKDTM